MDGPVYPLDKLHTDTLTVYLHKDKHSFWFVIHTCTHTKYIFISLVYHPKCYTVDINAKNKLF